jgi:metal-responsive CopG/Arc/MetJ family transcriptional regulator
MAKIQIDDGLLTRLKKVAQVAGYASVEEFIEHMIEKELSHLETAADEQQVIERLKGLGYLE